MCAGVTILENPPQLSGCTKVFTESAKSIAKTSRTIPASLAKTTASVSAPSPATSDADFDGFVL